MKAGASLYAHEAVRRDIYGERDLDLHASVAGGRLYKGTPRARLNYLRHDVKNTTNKKV